MDEGVIQSLVRSTQDAAIGAEAWIGRGDRKAADEAAVKGMRAAMNAIPFEGTVVIGEGERDKAPMLFIGEKVGTGGPALDLAVDPLEGTNMAAVNDYNAISILAASPKGTLLHAPDCYMDKVAVGPEVGRVVSLEKSVEENMKAVASALNKPVEEVRVVVLERDRNKEAIASLRALGCRIRLIRDGDVYGGISTCLGEADLLLGIGAAPEGVMTASAIKNLGGYFEGKLWFKDEKDRERAKGMGAPEHALTMDELVKGDDSVFIATGVTEGFLLDGVRRKGKKREVHSLIIRKGHVQRVKQVME